MNRILMRVMPILFAVAGCVCILSGITTMRNRQTFLETTAVITKIDEIYVGGEDNDYDYEVTVKYSADGQEYNSLLGEYWSGMQEGQEVGIYYNPEDPTDIMSDSKSMPVLQFVFGIIGILIGIVGFIRGFA